MTAQPLTVVDLVDRMRRGEDGAVRTELSGGALVGSMPAKLDGWSFQTDIRRRVSTELPGINLVTAIVVPLKKLRPTFKNTILVGRSDSNDVCIPHQSVSKLHARLWLRDEEVVIADAGSTHGTVVDGQRVDGERTLRSGCVIEFGDCCFRFLDTDSLVDALSRLSTRGEI